LSTIASSLQGDGTPGNPLAAHVFVWATGVTWDDFYAQLSLVSGPKICLIEFSNAGKVITARGGSPTDINDVLFIGVANTGHDYVGQSITVQNGFVLAGKNEFGQIVASISVKDCNLDFLTTAPIFTPVGSGSLDIEMDSGRVTSTNPLIVTGTANLRLRNMATAASSNPAGMFPTTNTNSTCELISQARLGSFVFVGSGATSVALTLDASCQWQTNVVVGSFVGGVLKSPLVMRNFAVDVAGNLYSISVVAGVVTGILV
jgi:hypothetical protein